MADIWDVMKAVHVPGPNVLYVGLNGNDANPGTSGSRKRTIDAAFTAMPAGGGIIYVGDGDYGSIGLYGRTFANNAWCLIKSENVWGAQASGGIVVSGQHVGVYGFDTPGGAIGCSSGAYLAVWRCHVHDTGGAGIYAAGNNGAVSNISWCYNLVSNTGWGDYQYAQSNMTAYEFKNTVGSQAHNWVNGYDNIVIGNISHSGLCAAGGDGNGLIIDDMHNQQMGGSVNYNGNWLVMGNLMINNIGVGVHILQSDNVDVCFNTSYHNSNGMDGNAGAVGTGGANALHYWANLLHNVPWFNGYRITDFQYDANVYLAGVDGGGGWDDTPMPNQRNRTADGLNYFTNSNPTLVPDLSTATQYVPDGGGSGVIESYTITQQQYDKWSTFPDLFGNYRPSNRTWSVGFAGSGGGTLPGPVAAFTVSDATPDQGQSITFTDQSTGSPTSWSWNFGESGVADLTDPGRKEVALEFISTAENSTLDWRSSYSYIEDIGDGRGYTAGIAGFCSGTGDMIMVVDRYIVLKPSGNVLQPYRAALAAVNGTASHAGLGTGFTNAWVTASSDPLFQQAQQEIRDSLYFTPAVNQAKADGLGALGQMCYFDHSILNGFDGMMTGIRNPVIAGGTLPPSQGGNESTYLNAWLARAIVQMDTDPAHSDHSRVIAQQAFRAAGKLNLELPLSWTMYGDPFSISSVTPPYGAATSTLQNPSHAWSTTGSKTVTLTVTNALGSSQVSHTYTVGGVVSGPGTITHPALGVHGHLLSSTSDGTTAGGKPRYKLSYQMTSITGAIITATAVAAFPAAVGSAPAGGWPIILAGHGATGTDDGSAPSGWSDDMSNAVGNVDSWLTAGYIVVQADYEGLNPANDALPHPYMVGVSAARSLLDAGLACAGLTTVKAAGAAVGFSQGGHASLFAAEYQASYAPQYVQFCAVGFDPVITSDYVNSIYTGQYSDEYLASIIYGQWIENSALTRTTVLSSGAAANLPNLETWDFGTTAANINFGNGSFVANPVSAGGGWSTAIYNNTPGHRIARPSRVYSPSGGIGGGDVWLNYALGSGTAASRETGSGGHQIINVSGAVSWVTSTLASQTGSGAPVAAFSFASTSPQVNDTVYFTDESQNAPTSWVWNFGDGSTSTLQNPSHAYTTTGTKTVTLTVTNAQGTNQTSHTVTVAVAGPPVVNFSMVPSPGTAGSPVQFTDLSSGAPTSWAWTFGD